MGQEIESTHFRRKDFELFEMRLRDETQLLETWFNEGRIADQEFHAGYEVETCLIDRQGHPAPLNTEFLEQLANPMVVPELSRFNLEINSHPHPLKGSVLRDSCKELESLRLDCNRVAAHLDAQLVMAGIVPTLKEEQLNLESMSGMQRFRALNEQVLRLRGGQPMRLDIQKEDHLVTEHGDLMLEAATTSFQIHMQVPPSAAANMLNLAQIISAPMVAVAANSPYLFGYDLWDETRIPLFEQAVAVSGPGEPERVGFGQSYVETVLDCFWGNIRDYPVILPTKLSESAEELAHLRLHNGTIWRWNRPLIGFDAQGTPHFRIEHRVLPAGPSVADSIANAALFFGLMSFLSHESTRAEEYLEFAAARTNFYTAARDGLQAQLQWFNGSRIGVNQLILEILLPQAKKGLQLLEIDAADIGEYLGIIKARTKSGMNGSRWQREYVRTHGADMQHLTEAYVARQLSGAPVHEWSI